MPQLSGKRGAKPAERDLAAVLWRTKRRDNTLVLLQSTKPDIAVGDWRAVILER